MELNRLHKPVPYFTKVEKKVAGQFELFGTYQIWWR